MKMIFALMIALSLSVGTAEAQYRHHYNNRSQIVVRPQVNNYYVVPLTPNYGYNYNYYYNYYNNYSYGSAWVNPYVPRYNLYPYYGFSYGYRYSNGFGFWK